MFGQRSTDGLHWTKIEHAIYIQGESKKTDTFDIQMNNKGVSFF
jgi:hypothetical protein